MGLFGELVQRSAQADGLTSVVGKGLLIPVS